MRGMVANSQASDTRFPLYPIFHAEEVFRRWARLLALLREFLRKRESFADSHYRIIRASSPHPRAIPFSFRNGGKLLMLSQPFGGRDFQQRVVHHALIYKSTAIVEWNIRLGSA